MRDFHDFKATNIHVDIEKKKKNKSMIMIIRYCFACKKVKINQVWKA